jgi:integrase
MSIRISVFVCTPAFSRRHIREILGLKWDYIRLYYRLINLPVTKNNTVQVLPVNDTIHTILSEMPEKSGYVFGNGNGG